MLFPSCFSICNIFEELIPQKLKKGSILAFCKVTSSAKRSIGSSFFFHFTIVLSTRLKTNMQSMSILCNRRVSFKFQFFFCRRLYFAKLHGFNHLKELSSWENATLLRKILSFNNSSVVKLLKNKELILLFACVFSWENTHTMMGKAIKLT